MIEQTLTYINATLAKITIPNPYIPADKQMHLITAAIGGAFLYIFIGWYAVTVISIIGVIKEEYDYQHPDVHTADIWDWVATTVGGAVGSGLAFLFLNGLAVQLGITL